MSTILLLLLLLTLFSSRAAATLPGSWALLVPDAGIASMHTAVTRFNTVVLLDRTQIGPSRKPFPTHRCPIPHDCTAHSVLLDLSTNSLRPLTILTDTWCSSGQFLPDGTLLQTGGGGLDGFRRIRRFSPCEPTSLCDWEELPVPELHQGRWYATNQILPDGSVIIVGGKSADTVEFFPPKPTSPAVKFPFLTETKDDQMDNLYPYVHLLPNGELFVFANDRAVSYDYNKNVVTRVYPALNGGPRNYPSAGSSAMLALTGDYSGATVLVCGGAVYGAYLERAAGRPARGSCGRIEATRPDADWEMEEMPFGRIMGDMVVLPTGDLVIVNGAMAGTQGFEMGSDPCLYPVLYRPDQPVGLRFMTLNPGTVPRMYHSTANLLPDGRVLVAGSNPHYFYKFDGTEYPTELRIEAFSPEYLSGDRANLRPAVVGMPEKVGYGEVFEVAVTVELPVVGVVEVNMASAPFATHSFSQGQRLVKLAVEAPAVEGGGVYRIKCTAPPDGRVAPPGYYMVFAVNQGVPSVARWVQLVAA
ncbi:glyoxal oxidase-related protein [Striga asiatica]|uniref:Aldehyde oxidase GLOX n=1 Tax=Striga asiatica TaxID=4170 RepID=A0A5A7QBR1_STRAF|nr:glyoxal oxidase-related protein [Striga asiatica]